MKRTLAIGDIHGCSTALQTLAKAVKFAKDDKIIFLGDYVDRGPDSKGVIEFLIGLQAGGYDVTCLRGNHEIMMIDAFEKRGRAAMSWLRFGGKEALKSYESNGFERVPEGHWQFLRALRPYCETEDHLFVHAGLVKDLPLPDQPDHALYWDFFDFPSPHVSGKTVVCGHSSQKNGRPIDVGHAICIDTWAYGDGWLTCLDVDRGHCWRTNQTGELREDPLTEIANAESVH